MRRGDEVVTNERGAKVPALGVVGLRGMVLGPWEGAGDLFAVVVDFGLSTGPLAMAADEVDVLKPGVRLTASGRLVWE